MKEKVISKLLLLFCFDEKGLEPKEREQTSLFIC